MKIESWRDLSLAYVEANKNNKGIDKVGQKKYVSLKAHEKEIEKFHKKLYAIEKLCQEAFGDDKEGHI